jgi:hypothetical protein
MWWLELRRFSQSSEAGVSAAALQYGKLSSYRLVRSFPEGFMSFRFRAALILISLFASVSSMAADPFSGGPLDVVLSGEVVSVKDNRTGDAWVLKGNKARAQARVMLAVRGFAGGSLREWLEGRLPLKVQGYFEREDKGAGLVTRFKPVTFALDPATLRCQKDEAPEFRLCTAEYIISRSNTVDVPAGDGGEHVIALQMLPPGQVDFPIQMARGISRPYSVLTGKPTLTMFQFAGLPQH